MTTPSRRDLANAIRFLAVDAVEAAKSGHPGMPMGMADIAEVLWNDYLSHNPNNPKWFNRDRFVLSNGHGSMLQYALLHLSGYDLPIEELKHFRQLESKTPGHPENFMTPGVETTTGPLGQGFANAVGLALAEKLLAQRFNRPEFAVVDHRTWVFMGDGCLMEGISHEAASLAGTWGLGKLVAFWDDNKISIDGNTDGWFTDDTPARFEAYGWHVIRNVDGHDRGRDQDRDRHRAEVRRQADADLLPHHDRLRRAEQGRQGILRTARRWARTNSPPRARRWAGRTAPFEIPQEIYDGWRAGNAGLVREDQWNPLFDAYAAQHPELAAELVAPLARRAAGRLRRAGRCLHRQAAGRRPGDRLAQGLADGDRSLRAAAAGTDRRLGRPRAFQPDAVEGQQVGRQRRSQRQLRLLRRARIRDDRDQQRPGAARRLHSVRRHLPGVQRLRAQRRAHERADGRARDPRLHARLDRPGRGRPDAPADRAPGARCATSRNNDVWRPCDAVESAVCWRAAIERQRRPELPGVLAPEPARTSRATRSRSPTSRAAATC